MNKKIEETKHTIRAIHISNYDKKAEIPITISIERAGPPHPLNTDLVITVTHGGHEQACLVNSIDLLEAIYFLTDKSVIR